MGKLEELIDKLGQLNTSYHGDTTEIINTHLELLKVIDKPTINKSREN